MKRTQVMVVGVLLAALQPAGPSALAAEESTASGGLEEVVVTAQKRAQNAQDVGISLSAVSGSDLQQMGAVAATDITRSVPAVVMTQPNGPSSFSLSIRGVTQNDFADHQESPAAIATHGCDTTGLQRQPVKHADERQGTARLPYLGRRSGVREL